MHADILLQVIMFLRYYKKVFSILTLNNLIQFFINIEIYLII